MKRQNRYSHTCSWIEEDYPALSAKYDDWLARRKRSKRKTQGEFTAWVLATAEAACLHVPHSSDEGTPGEAQALTSEEEAEFHRSMAMFRQ